MSTLKSAWSRTGKVNAVALLASAALLLVVLFAIAMMATRVDAAGANSRRCIGTYLVVEGSGVQSLWTFGTDGTLQVTSSAEDAETFSHMQGAWKRIGPGMVETTSLDFDIDGVHAPTSIARVDALVTFSNACSNVAGTFELRFYPTPADPLDINAATVVFSDTLTGREVTTD